MNRLAGRFELIERLDEQTVVVGCLGSLKAKTLTEAEQRYLAEWYIDGFPSRVTLIKAEVLSDYSCEQAQKHPNNYNDFIKLTVQRKNYY